jgi:ribosomal RNA-processing protein 1
VVRREYLDLIRELPLHPRDPKVPGGLRYHVADVWIDELEKVGAGDEGATPFRDLLGPVVELSQKALLKSVRKRVKETLDDDRVRLWLGIEREKDHDELREVEAGDEDEEFGGFDD